jgi:hypothetical protein
MAGLHWLLFTNWEEAVKLLGIHPLEKCLSPKRKSVLTIQRILGVQCLACAQNHFRCIRWGAVLRLRAMISLPAGGNFDYVLHASLLHFSDRSSVAAAGANCGAGGEHFHIYAADQ